MANTHSLNLELSSSQYAWCADSASLSITGDISIEMWVKLEQLSSTATSTFTLATKYQEASNYSFYFNIQTSDKLRFFYTSDGNNVNYTYFTADAATFTAADVGVWVHIAITVDVSAKTAVMYKNGSVVADSATDGGAGATAIADTGARFEIGSSTNGSTDYFDGLIDEVRVWNDIRSEAEIIANMKQDVSAGEDGLAGYWQLEDDYLDKTANDNDLTASGSPVFSATVPFSDYGITAKFFSSAGDGAVLSQQATWAAARENDDGTSVDYETATQYIVATNAIGGPTYLCYHGYLPFVTSDLPDDITITSASYFLYLTEVTDTDTVSLVTVQSSQASITELATTDYNNCGALDSPTEGASRVAYSTLSITQYNEIPLDATGFTFIDSEGNTLIGMRDSKDVDDATPSGGNRIQTRISQYANATFDPYLLVTYTETSTTGAAFLLNMI